MSADLHVLVAFSGRHEATAEIARCRADAVRLGSGGRAQVDVRDAAQVSDVGCHDAVVVGSAGYAGRWTRAAQDMVEHCAIGLWARPVWLFSTGPVGIPPRPDTALFDVDRVLVLSMARDHRAFAGRLDRSRLNRRERLRTRVVRAQDGDARGWAAVRAWGTLIGAALAAEEARS